MSPLNSGYLSSELHHSALQEWLRWGWPICYMCVFSMLVMLQTAQSNKNRAIEIPPQPPRLVAFVVFLCGFLGWRNVHLETSNSINLRSLFTKYEHADYLGCVFRSLVATCWCLAFAELLTRLPQLSLVHLSQVGGTHNIYTHIRCIYMYVYLLLFLLQPFHSAFQIPHMTWGAAEAFDWARGRWGGRPPSHLGQEAPWTKTPGSPWVICCQGNPIFFVCQAIKTRHSMFPGITVFIVQSDCSWFLVRWPFQSCHFCGWSTSRDWFYMILYDLINFFTIPNQRCTP